MAAFLSASRNHVVEIVNGLLAGWAEPLPPVEYLGMFPHETELTPVPKLTLEELEQEFEVLFQLGLDLWFDEEQERRRLGPPPWFDAPEQPPGRTPRIRRARRRRNDDPKDIAPPLR